MNTSFGPHIDADRWDFHDGIDLPAPVGTPVHAMAKGEVHRAGPVDKTGPGQGFGFDQDFGLGWKPWASPPITSTFKIPFEYNG